MDSCVGVDCWLNADTVRLLITFFGGAVVAWILTWARDYFRRPVLGPSVDHRFGSLVETTTVNAKVRQKYARIVVRNNGRSMALNAAMTVDYVKRIDPEGTEFVFSTDLIDLPWSNGMANKIPAKSRRLVDVVSNQQEVNASSENFLFGFASPVPVRLANELKTPAAYELHALVYADNCKPAELSFRVKVGRTWDELEIESCSDPRC
jgi:hypothetical protein